jgi:hypothetical protein
MKLAPLALLLIPSLAAAGSIKGKVRFDGTPPPSGTSFGADPVCTAGDHPTSEVVVDAKGGLAQAVVYLKKAKAQAAPADPVVVTQDGCEYTPRVVVVRDGQKLEIHNGDPTFHNVRGNQQDGKVAFNLPQNKGAKPIVRDDLGDPGDVVSLACDVHPWMKGWAMVLDHPYFAITAADGSFVIDGLKPGKYELVAWHPTLGTKKKKVTVKKGKKAAKASFVFDAD